MKEACHSDAPSGPRGAGLRPRLDWGRHVIYNTYVAMIIIVGL